MDILFWISLIAALLCIVLGMAFKSHTEWYIVRLRMPLSVAYFLLGLIGLVMLLVSFYFTMHGLTWLPGPR